MKQSEFLKKAVGTILAAIGFATVTKAEDKRFVGAEIDKLKIDEVGLTRMPYPNMGIMVPKDHPWRRISLEWVDGRRFDKVKVVETPDGQFAVWEPKKKTVMKRQIKDYLHLYIGCEVTKDHGEGVIEKGTLVGVCKSEVEPDRTIVIVDRNGYEFVEWYIEEAKPSLWVTAKMTQADKEEFRKFGAMSAANILPEIPSGPMLNWFESYRSCEITRFLLARHYDIFNLIPEGLANERVD